MRERKRKPKYRSGFVAILGRPNAGKSTLLNRLLGTKLAIVANKPQTTRTTIQGVWTSAEAQVIFVDTPGLHEGESLMNRRMMETISAALDGKDLILYLADATRTLTAEDEKALAIVKASRTPVLLVLNKIDKVSGKAALLPLIEAHREKLDFVTAIPVSALTGEGLELLFQEILSVLPAGPAYFPEDYLTDQPERFMAAEVVREKVLAETRQEVPHSVAVLVEEWKEEGKLLRILATIYVEKPGQKAIILGTKGAKLKAIGTAARQELEGFFGRKIFLGLFVKVQPGWRENPTFLKELDWRSMAGVDATTDSE